MTGPMTPLLVRSRGTTPPMPSEGRLEFRVWHAARQREYEADREAYRQELAAAKARGLV